MPYSKCLWCGRPVVLGYGDPKLPIWDAMRRQRLCHSCAAWDAVAGDPDVEVLDGVAMRMLPWQDDMPPGTVAGDGPLAVRHPDGTYRTSNDVWRIGTVPAHLRFMLPDTCERRPLAEGLSSMRNLNKCHNRACFDRYTCRRYEEPEGTVPFNITPVNWKPGGERCPDYIPEL